jgi:L-threonylcarbamoyladenylate synthase
MPAQPRDYAAALYATLHRCDEQGYDWIAVEEPPDLPEWEAIRDRLRRAASRP